MSTCYESTHHIHEADDCDDKIEYTITILCCNIDMWLQLGNLLKGKHSMRSVIPDADGAIRTMGKTIAVTTIPTIINASNMSAHQGSSFNFFLQPMIHNEVFFLPHFQTNSCFLTYIQFIYTQPSPLFSCQTDASDVSRGKQMINNYVNFDFVI